MVYFTVGALNTTLNIYYSQLLLYTVKFHDFFFVNIVYRSRLLEMLLPHFIYQNDDADGYHCDRYHKWLIGHLYKK